VISIFFFHAFIIPHNTILKKPVAYFSPLASNSGFKAGALCPLFYMLGNCIKKEKNGNKSKGRTKRIRDTKIKPLIRSEIKWKIITIYMLCLHD